MFGCGRTRFSVSRRKKCDVELNLIIYISPCVFGFFDVFNRVLGFGDIDCLSICSGQQRFGKLEEHLRLRWHLNLLQLL